jgi:hypothetical protein
MWVCIQMDKRTCGFVGFLLILFKVEEKRVFNHLIIFQIFLNSKEL